MAHFKVWSRGSRSGHSQLAGSGGGSTLNDGWSLGVGTRGYCAAKDGGTDPAGTDTFEVSVTGGSNARCSAVTIATVTPDAVVFNLGGGKTKTVKLAKLREVAK